MSAMNWWTGGWLRGSPGGCVRWWLSARKTCGDLSGDRSPGHWEEDGGGGHLRPQAVPAVTGPAVVGPHHGAHTGQEGYVSSVSHQSGGQVIRPDQVGERSRYVLLSSWKRIYFSGWFSEPCFNRFLVASRHPWEGKKHWKPSSCHKKSKFR